MLSHMLLFAISSRTTDPVIDNLGPAHLVTEAISIFQLLSLLVLLQHTSTLQFLGKAGRQLKKFDCYNPSTETVSLELLTSNTGQNLMRQQRKCREA